MPRNIFQPGNPGGGRPAGRPHNVWKERKAFCEMVFGKPDSIERQEFAEELRWQFMEGSIHPAIATLVMQWWLGKPKEIVEIQTPTVGLEELTDEQLATRAQLVAIAAEAAAAQSKDSEQETESGTEAA